MRARFLVLCCAAAIVLTSSGLAWGDLRVLEAVKRRDHKAVASLVRVEKADVNVAQPDGATALAWAAHLNDSETAELLLAAGAKADTVDEYGESPLTQACAHGNGALVEKLLKAGANAKLMIAAGAGSAQAVKLLIERGADLSAVEPKRGQNALMWAAAEGHSDAVEVLIKAGADVNVTSKGGFNALVFAATKNDHRSEKLVGGRG
jgi:ankyrin repeat protein